MSTLAAGSRVASSLQGDAQCFHPIAVQLDPHLPLPAPGDPDLRHSRELLQNRRHQPSRDSAKLGEIRPPRRGQEPHGEHRFLARIEAADQDLVHIGIALDRAHRLLDLHQAQIHVRFPVEGDPGDQAARPGHLLDGPDTPHRKKPLLHQLAVETLHLHRGPIPERMDTTTVGLWRSGRRSMGSLRREIQPRMTTATARTVTATGRLVARRAVLSLPLRRSPESTRQDGRGVSAGAPPGLRLVPTRQD